MMRFGHLLGNPSGERPLKSLTFTTIPKDVVNPTLDRRSKVIARLEEQKLLLNDPKYVRTVRTWVKKDGRLMPLDRQERVLPWWRVNTDGFYVLFVRWGGRPIEFEKGKNGIAVPSLNKIPVVIDILITAVRNGELDAQLAQAKKPTTALRALKAARIAVERADCEFGAVVSAFERAARAASESVLGRKSPAEGGPRNSLSAIP